MWLLTKITEEGTLQYLISQKRSYTVGRKNSDIILSDSSISRTHCIINIAPRKECPFPVQTLTGVWIIEKNSKYGTYIQRDEEWVKLDGEKVQELSNGTIIRFGLMGNIWRLDYKPLIVCTSRLSNEQNQELKSQLMTVDGKLLSKWIKYCTVVFVNDITLTAKVLLALITGVPIVTTHYLKQLIENVQQNLPWPDYKLYRPQITESTLMPHLVSLDPECDRKELFKGKTFYLPTEKQLENLKEIIMTAGGEVEYLKLDENWRKLANEDSIVIQLPCERIINPDESAKLFKNVTGVLKNEYHVRAVPETEIYQAIAYSSIEKYCNPKCKEFEFRYDSGQDSLGHVIVEETPYQSVDRGVSVNTDSEMPDPQPCTSRNKDEEDTSHRYNFPHKERITKRSVSDAKLERVNITNASSSHAQDDIDSLPKTDSQEAKTSREKSRTRGRINLTSVMQTLTISKRNASELQDGDLNNANERQTKKPKITSIDGLDTDFEEFWAQAETEDRLLKTDSKKRKLSDDSNKTHTPGKRICTEEEPTHSKNINPVEKPTTSSVSRGKTSKKNTVKDKPEKQKLPSSKILVDAENEGVWYRKKNSDKYVHGNPDDGLENVVRLVKTFKKRVYIPPDDSLRRQYTQEEYDEIDRKLLAEGWHRSHAYRMRLKSTNQL